MTATARRSVRRAYCIPPQPSVAVSAIYRSSHKDSTKLYSSGIRL